MRAWGFPRRFSIGLVCLVIFLVSVFPEVRPHTSYSHASYSLSGLPCPLSSMRTQGPIKASPCCNTLYSYLENVEDIGNPHYTYNSPVTLGFRLCLLRHVDTSQEYV